MIKDFSNKREMLKYVGDLSQLFSIKDCTLQGGRAQGIRALEIRNGSGLEFTVLPDRGLDIAWLSFNNKNFSYISKTGIVGPQYYEERGLGFLRGFFAGFLTTCGLTSAGAPSNDNDEEFGLHGRISNTPADEVFATTEWVDQQPSLNVGGRLREARVFGENLILERKISCKAGESSFQINDTIENCGFREEPLMLLYHFNLGYPLLDENSYFLAPSLKVEPRDSEAAKGIEDYSHFQPPTAGYSEQVFYHKLKSDSNGNTFAALINPDLELGVVMHFNINQLKNLTQWKQMGEGEYVLGIEPCNCFVSGRAKAREEGTLEFIKPGEVKNFSITIEILEGSDNIRKFTQQVNEI